MPFSEVQNNAFIRDNRVKLYIRVRYSECDAQQVVFNARYADYADLAATEYIRALVGGYDKLLSEGIDNQVVNLTIDWFASAKFDDRLCLEIGVSHIGNTSFALTTFIYREQEKSEESQVLLARISTTYVVIEPESQSKRPIPKFLRACFDNNFDVDVNQAAIA